MLGILKAGAAYLPLDPAYPRGRLEFMAQDAEVPLIRADERWPVPFAESMRVLYFETQRPETTARLQVETVDRSHLTISLSVCKHTNHIRSSFPRLCNPKECTSCSSRTNYFTGAESSSSLSAPYVWFSKSDQ